MDPAIVDSISMVLCFGSPFFCGLGGLIAWLFFQFKVKELEVRKVEAEIELTRTRQLAGAPEWLDANDPLDLEAWKRARGEISSVVVPPSARPRERERE